MWPWCTTASGRPWCWLNDLRTATLNFGDETGVLARFNHNCWSGSVIYKHEEGPFTNDEFVTWTWGGRYKGPLRQLGQLEAELALQYQDGRVDAVTIDGPVAFGDGWATAGQAFLTLPLAGQATDDIAMLSGASLELGGFYYSGAGESLKPFHAPWGNWPKWSELYIYSLLGESTTGRPHVAAWENVAAPRATVRWPLAGRHEARLGVTWLQAPEPEWTSRGVLVQAQVQGQLGHGLTGHLLYEWFDAGEFHNGEGHGLPMLGEPVSFLRWQMEWKF